MELWAFKYAKHVTTDPTKILHYRQIRCENFQNSTFDQIWTHFQPYNHKKDNVCLIFMDFAEHEKVRDVRTIIFHPFLRRELRYVSESKGAIFETMKLYEYLSSAFKVDMPGYVRFEICTMHLFLYKNKSLYKTNVKKHLKNVKTVYSKKVIKKTCANYCFVQKNDQ